MNEFYKIDYLISGYLVKFNLFVFLNKIKKKMKLKKIPKGVLRTFKKAQPNKLNDFFWSRCS